METATKISVVVVEDEPLILNSIVKKIEASESGFHVVATAQDGAAALEAVCRYTPEVLITDIQMPIMNGLELIKAVNTKFPSIIKVVISGFNDFKFAQTAIQYEVKDYLLKPVKKEQLNDTLKRLRFSIDACNNRLSSSILFSKRGSSCSAEEIAHMVEIYIKNNYRNDVNLDLIAQNFSFNASYLSKIFTRYIGENPSKYLISLRINEAKRLLINHRERSVKEVGEIVGYTDQYHFSHIFKLVTGKSPANYRDVISL
jgi:two-component system response regulator YesN